jgi:hypothetical protein
MTGKFVKFREGKETEKSLALPLSRRKSGATSNEADSIGDVMISVLLMESVATLSDKRKRVAELSTKWAREHVRMKREKDS